MNKILLPTDFSDNAKIAANNTVEIAKKFNSEIYLLNTYNINTSHSSFFINLDDKLKSSSMQSLKIEKQRLIDLGVDKNKIILFCEHGTLTHVIHAMEKEFHFSLIVMGTKGSSGIDDILIGTRTADVISFTKTAVLVIPEKSTICNFDHIVYAADFKESRPSKDLKTMLEFANLFKADIKVLRVLRSKEEETAFIEFDNIGVKYDKWLQGIKHSFHYQSNENIENGINDFIEKNDANLLAVLARKRGLLGRLFHSSISKKLCFHCSIPVLIMKEN